MFEFIRRLLGGRDQAAPGDAAPVAVITVRGRGIGAAPFNPASLSADDAAGTCLLACDVSIDPFPPFGERFTQLGSAPIDYRVDAVLPARPDPGGQALFGPNPMLRLRAAGYGAGNLSRPDTLLIHGGPPGRPTDGSIRMADADLAQLVALLPADPQGVSVRLIQDAEDDPAAVIDAERRRRDDQWGDDGWEDCAVYYAQLYDWTEPPPGLPPYPDLPVQTEQDQAVAASLAELGYGGTAEAPVSSVPAGESASAADWTPPGGAYSQ